VNLRFSSQTCHHGIKEDLKSFCEAKVLALCGPYGVSLNMLKLLPEPLSVCPYLSNMKMLLIVDLLVKPGIGYIVLRYNIQMVLHLLRF